MAFCAACQIEVANAKFCTTCGRQLVDASAPAESQVSTPAATSSKNLAMWAHLAPLLAVVAGFLTAGIIWILLWLPGVLIRQSASATDFDRRHATESLNFQLSLLLYIAAGTVFSIITIGIGLLIAGPALIGLAIAALVFNIMAISAANAGREYRYPLTIRFVK
ncbi:MAG: DUF4870 domain-containing protein [Micrococcales bacterium]|nr:DUF4870 domain-containing protein [Microbacteriaceae bacterium]NBR23537.1 DUF4870 domain-containing protein [Micrococcales bacterium]NBR77635.1 DUF4870 domain-containing protein [Microbacteriaceae bacterium]NBS86202.1 DUF4870 domain-containing protein [Micrococcales bacterium]NBX94565.1 DUF4870 domain-containing protein [Actinomycetota bacterium]